jgi:hypothetical protein
MESNLLELAANIVIARASKTEMPTDQFMDEIKKVYSYINTTTGPVHELIELANANGNFNASNYALLKSPRAGSFFDVVSQDYIIQYSVPEPTTLLLLSAGLVFLAGLKRKY